MLKGFLTLNMCYLIFYFPKSLHLTIKFLKKYILLHLKCLYYLIFVIMFMNYFFIKNLKIFIYNKADYAYAFFFLKVETWNRSTYENFYEMNSYFFHIYNSVAWIRYKNVYEIIIQKCI